VHGNSGMVSPLLAIFWNHLEAMFGLSDRIDFDFDIPESKRQPIFNSGLGEAATVYCGQVICSVNSRFDLSRCSTVQCH
jgi:hypothetical protein